MDGIPTSTRPDPLARLLEVLDLLEIPYEIGGSVASSAHGIPRTTLDIDIVVDLQPGKIDAFAKELSGEFYADAGLIREAFAYGRGVCRTTGQSLDIGYLRRWAPVLKVADLLETLLAECIAYGA